MQLTCIDLSDGIRQIHLAGRLDIEGACAIDLKLSTLVATGARLVVVDLSDVDFMASLGLSTLVQAAKAANLRGGKLVMMAPQPNVAKVLVSTRVAERIPVCPDLAQARIALGLRDGATMGD
jgi:anti-sigma B factor antagonist